MAPAGNNKFSSKAMAETFYLSNIVPQDFDNNSGYWNRIEMYCRELTERFEDVWVVSGPLTLPQTRGDGKKIVSYQVIGEDNVAVPSHLYKDHAGCCVESPLGTRTSEEATARIQERDDGGSDQRSGLVELGIYFEGRANRISGRIGCRV
ncbi:endonuclease G-like 1, isoform CRA_b [Homo sapiens]|uniref:Isoform 2 of Nuclease EXOG, mitochondrial n=1 Tax=Homo sapiens TaxID=9606 RepID=Q9Y2C4-2|nr:endonuclease G-like 1, isoform CRA_b [Homo sapiens]EAW64539.1 endonuclease G-like 1, isoform CRA_b [Homo sapiens]BAA76753.1 endonuclease G-like protein-2 [Homo sapiens]